MITKTDLEIIEEALPALMRIGPMVQRIAYLEERCTFDAVVGRVYQATVCDWVNELQVTPGWSKDDAITGERRVDKLWRMSNLIKELYPEAVKKVTPE